MPSFDLGPSYEELAELNRNEAHALSRQDALARLEQALPRFSDGAQRATAELLTYVRAAHDDVEAARSHARELLREVLRAAAFPVRPGTVEDVWYLEGLIDRVLRA